VAAEKSGGSRAKAGSPARKRRALLLQPGAGAMGAVCYSSPIYGLHLRRRAVAGGSRSRPARAAAKRGYGGRRPDLSHRRALGWRRWQQAASSAAWCCPTEMGAEGMGPEEEAAGRGVRLPVRQCRGRRKVATSPPVQRQEEGGHRSAGKSWRPARTPWPPETGEREGGVRERGEEDKVGVGPTRINVVAVLLDP
jgi:hypothetical protein